MRICQRWLRSAPPEEFDQEKGKNVDLAITMVIDTSPGDYVYRNKDGSMDVGIMGVNKEVGNLLPTRNISRVKGKQVTVPTNEIDFNKESGEDLDEGIIVNDSKRRRSQLGLGSILGCEDEVPPHLIILLVDLKNGPMVGLVDQAHWDQ